MRKKKLENSGGQVKPLVVRGGGCGCEKIQTSGINKSKVPSIEAVPIPLMVS
jgi:hypothetical protein